MTAVLRAEGVTRVFPAPAGEVAAVREVDLAVVRRRSGGDHAGAPDPERPRC